MNLTLSLILSLFTSLPLFAQVNVGIQADPCAGIKGTNNLALDFGGFCKYEALNKKLPPAGPHRVVLGSTLPAKEFSWRPGIKPAQTIQAFNKWLRTYAKKSGHTYIDYHSALTDANGGLPTSYSNDGVHPNQTGYAVMKPLAARGIHKANRY